jgi:hypothetical protein
VIADFPGLAFPNAQPNRPELDERLVVGEPVANDAPLGGLAQLRGDDPRRVARARVTSESDSRTPRERLNVRDARIERTTGRL